MWRYFNMFVLIGIALLVISLFGFATGNRFLTEPGQPVNPQGALIYLGAGVIMIVNGIVSIRHATAVKPVTIAAHGNPSVASDAKATE